MKKIDILLLVLFLSVQVSYSQPNVHFSVYPGETKEKGFVRLNNFETQLPAFMSFMKENNITIKHMECRRKTLDDLFVSLTGRTINE